MDKIASPAGIMFDYPSRNIEAAEKHEKGDQHLRTLEHLKYMATKELIDDDYLSRSSSCEANDALTVTERHDLLTK